MIKDVTTRAACIAIIIAGLPSVVHAGKRATDDLFERASAVVVGEVQSGRLSGKDASFVLLVSRAIKGVLAPNDLANVTWASVSRGGDHDLQGTFGMWFLGQAGPNHWKVFAPNGFQMCFPITRSAPMQSAGASQPQTPQDRLAAEFVATLQTTKDRKELIGLASAFLGLSETTFIKDLYRSLRANPDPELKFVGLTGALRLNDLTALTEIARNVDRLPNAAVRDEVLREIGARRETTRDVIEAMGRLAESPDAIVQQYAASVLRFIHTRDTLPLLVRLLDSSRPLVREDAVVGLSSFVRNLPIESATTIATGKYRFPQGPAPYQTAETERYTPKGPWLGKIDDREYIQFWKSWWAKMKDQIK